MTDFLNLDPCPFCCGKAELRLVVDNCKGQQRGYVSGSVRCSSCGVKTEAKSIDVDGETAIDPRWLSSIVGKWNKRAAPLNPDTLSPPGETLKDMMLERGMDLTSFSEKIGIDPGLINLVMDHGKSIPLTMAIALEAAGFGSAEFWVERERLYRERLGISGSETVFDPT